MTRPSSLLRIVAASCLATAAPLHAEAKFSGSTGYKLANYGTSVTVTCDRITNTSSENATGTLMVKLWALNSPYNGGTLSGHLMASQRLEGMSGGQYYNAMSRTLKCTTPARAGNYVICLTLSEYRNGGYVIVDHRNFSGTASLSPPKTFIMESPWFCNTSFEGGTVEMTVAKIAHTRTGHTGGLRLSAWATQRPYHGGDISGTMLGSVDKQPLQPGYSYTNVKNVAKLKRPPEGWYFVSLVLMEYNDGGYKIMAHLTSEKAVWFRAP